MVSTPAARNITISFDDGWRSFASLHGGLVAGLLVKAARDLVDESATGPAAFLPQAFTAHFLEAVAPNKLIKLTASADRLRSTASVRVAASQDTTLRAVAQALFAAVSNRPAHPWTARVPTGPVLPPGPDTAEPLELPRDYVPVSQKYEIRAVGPERPMGAGDHARLTAWVRLREPAGLDPLMQLAIIADALPPSLFAVTDRPVFMPTIELTAHLFGAPPQLGAWLRVAQRTEWANSWACVDAASIVNEQGETVATVRQTRRNLASS